MVFDNIQEIATHIASKWLLPEGVSGALVDTVDLNRIKVQNFADVGIDADDIPETYQDIITDFSKADVLEESFAWSATVAISGGAIFIDEGASAREGRKLGDMDVKAGGASQLAALNFLSAMSKETPDRLRSTARDSLNDLGRNISFFKSNG